MTNVFLLFLVITTTALASPCDFSANQLDEMLAMDFQSFDQTDGKGFRELEDRGCWLNAAILIDSWHLQNKMTLKDWQERISYFHAGQAFSCAGTALYSAAIKRFERSFNPGEKSDADLAWNSYVAATIAFL